MHVDIFLFNVALGQASKAQIKNNAPSLVDSEGERNRMKLSTLVLQRKR